MKKSIKSLAIALIAVPAIMCFSNNVKAQDDMSSDKMKMKDGKMKMKDDKIKMKMDMSVMKSWPMSSQMAVKEQMDLYGKPNEITPTAAIWYNNGPWKKNSDRQNGIKT
jgi:starvation-inducible outer membrane lipoprotein